MLQTIQLLKGRKAAHFKPNMATLPDIDQTCAMKLGMCCEACKTSASRTYSLTKCSLLTAHLGKGHHIIRDTWSQEVCMHHAMARHQLDELGICVSIFVFLLAVPNSIVWNRPLVCSENLVQTYP